MGLIPGFLAAYVLPSNMFPTVCIGSSGYSCFLLQKHASRLTGYSKLALDRIERVIPSDGLVFLGYAPDLFPLWLGLI